MTVAVYFEMQCFRFNIAIAIMYTLSIILVAILQICNATVGDISSVMCAVVSCV